MKVPNMIDAKVNNSLQGAIMDLIQTDYQHMGGGKIQDMFAKDITELVQECYKDPWKLDVGQILWNGVKTSAKPNYGRNSQNTPMTHIVLTLIAKEDLESIRAGYSTEEVLEKKAVRLFNEAYEQGALLTHSDVAYLLNISTGRVSKLVKKFMEENKVVVPTRGIIHDIGSAVTHKKIIVNLYKQGYQTPEIARMTDHTEEACDRYIKGFKRVKKLNEKFKLGEIAQTLGMGKKLVEEYIGLINDEVK